MNLSPNCPILYLKLTLTAVFWDGTFIAGRIVAQEMGPFWAAFLRFVVASVILSGFIFKIQRKLTPVRWKELLTVTALGLTGVFAYNAFFFSGLKTVTASRASLIITSNPAFIALFAALIFHERLTPWKILGIALSVSGAEIVVSKGQPLLLFDGNLSLGELSIFGWVAYSLIGKAALTRLSPLVSVTYACVIGAICCPRIRMDPLERLLWTHLKVA